MLSLLPDNLQDDRDKLHLQKNATSTTSEFKCTSSGAPGLTDCDLCTIFFTVNS